MQVLTVIAMVDFDHFDTMRSVMLVVVLLNSVGSHHVTAGKLVVSAGDTVSNDTGKGKNNHSDGEQNFQQGNEQTDINGDHREHKPGAVGWGSPGKQAGSPDGEAGKSDLSGNDEDHIKDQ